MSLTATILLSVLALTGVGIIYYITFSWINAAMRLKENSTAQAVVALLWFLALGFFAWSMAKMVL